MIPQYFKGDAEELKFDAAGKPMFDIVNAALDAFKAGGFQASPFLLMLYDEGRAPFSDRVPRDSFVEFIKEALTRFPFTGTFESYIFILEAIFGAGSGVLFEVPAAGKLNIAVNAAASIQFNFQFHEFEDGSEVVSNAVDSSGNQMVFGGVAGIDSECELAQLLAEIIPAGVFTEVTLAFFALYNFVDSAGNGIKDHLGNHIVFIET